MPTDRRRIINFINEQIAYAPLKVEAYVFDEVKKKRPYRNIFIRMQQYLQDFLDGEKSRRWITLTGLRGAGKTTVLSQIFYEFRATDAYKLFLSLDQTYQLLGASLDEVINTFEEVIGRSLEQLDKPMLLFIDEAQYDPKWGIVLKTVYDRSNKVFIFVTGSAALLLNTDSNIARRTIPEKLFPLSFPEFLKISSDKFETKGLCLEIRKALFEVSSAKESYEKLLFLEKQADQYYLGVTQQVFNKYLNYGSLPFMVDLDNEALVYDLINKTIDRVITGDILSLGIFSSEMLSKIPAILYAIADMDAFNYQTIATAFEISRPKVIEIFSTLVQTELLQKILPLGSHLNQVRTNQLRKPSKFVFSSPAFRAMYYKLVGNTISQENARGKLLEDLVSMYLLRIFHKHPAKSLTFDGEAGGADFVLGLGIKKIVIEVGAGSKGFRQVAKTSKKVNADYSIVICDDELTYSEEHNAVRVPLRLFLLT